MPFMTNVGLVAVEQAASVGAGQILRFWMPPDGHGPTAFLRKILLRGDGESAGAGGLARAHSQAWANFWNALARCDRARDPSGGRPCFSPAVISPKVRAWPSGMKMGS